MSLQLRTKEQLGYIVHSALWELNALAGLRIIVQSERTAEYLEERIEALWSSFRSTLLEMDDSDFDKEKESLASKLEEKPKSLAGEYVLDLDGLRNLEKMLNTSLDRSSRYWGEVESGEFDFGQRKPFSHPALSTRTDSWTVRHTAEYRGS